MGETMKVWVTKYALSCGIYEVEVMAPSGSSTIVRTPSPYVQFFYSSEWHLTKEAAIHEAEKMCLNKIASLKKQIAKLEKMRFE